MRIYDIEFKDELKVTKAETKCFGFDYDDELINKNCSLRFVNGGLEFSTESYKLPYCRDRGIYYKWVLTDELQQGDIVKPIDYKIDYSLYIFDKHNPFKMCWCWCIYKNRPKECIHDHYMYKLVCINE
jgi:hypothetical protein